MLTIVNKVAQWFRNVGSLEKLDKMRAYEDQLRYLRLHDPSNLLLKGYGVFSQSDEDGIIQEIFHRIGTTNQHAVEIAAGNGLESNTHLLLQTGWHCTWFEADERNTTVIANAFGPWIVKDELKLLKRWVTTSSLEGLLAEAGVPKEFDLLSLDIDGQEFWLWQALTKWKPRVVIAEYNATLGPDVDLTVPKDDAFVWDQRSLYCGASLQALVRLAKKKGYTLVCCNYTGVNAFFVRSDLVKKHFPKKDPAVLFQKANLGGYVRPGYLRTVNQWEVANS